MTTKQRVRAAARYAALDGLTARQKLTGGRSALERPRVHFPYLHAVPPTEEDDFRRLLAKLAEKHTFVSYSEAVDRVKSGDIDKPYVSFSFDDGFASNVRTAAILEEFGAVGCFFVATDFIGVKTLQDAHALFGYTQGIDEHAMTWGDLEDLKARGHEIGNHTCTHRQISQESPERVRDEIARAAETLRSRLGSVEHFAWPFGRFHHFTDEAARVVFETGHASCASAERGAHVPGGDLADDQICIRRDHIMTSWPLRHSLYFLTQSAAAAASHTWPQDWSVSDER